MGEKGYPPALSHVDAPPPLLYAKGRLELADGPIVAMVGARNGSAVGQKLTRQLATELGLEGFVIASGLARGIDTAAHLASLERGTIAVLAGGIDVVYPPENADLQRAIGEQGLLLSERNPGFAPRGKDFPRRNRLISGISLGGHPPALPASRAARSLPCRAALSTRAPPAPTICSSRALASLPAPATSSKLWRLFLAARSSRSGLSCPPRVSPEPLPEIAQSERERIIGALGPSPVDIYEVARATGIAVRKVHIVLPELDLARKLQRHGQQLVSLIGED